MILGGKLPAQIKDFLNSFTVSLSPDTKIGPELYTHSNTLERAWCGVKIWPILTGSLPCEFCVVK